MKKHRILVTARVFSQGGHEPEALLREAGGELVFLEEKRPLTEDRLLESLTGVSAVVASPGPYSERVFAAATDLWVVSRWGVGYDTVDVTAATRHGVVVTTTPGTLHDSVADLVFALLLAVARNVPRADRRVRQGNFRYPGGVLVWGKQLGIVGLGTIGKAVARRARGFNMTVVAHDLTRDEAFARKHGVRYVSLAELLETSDFVTLHCNLTEQSRGLIGAEELARMKPTAYLINTARGTLVDEEALVESLKTGAIAGAALDVFAAEPLPAEHPLTQLDNCVLAPHCGSFSRETIHRISLVAARNVVDVLSGRRCPNALNPEVYDSPALRAPVD